MDTVPEIFKQKLFCTCCKNIHTIIVKSQNKTDKKLLINMNPIIQQNKHVMQNRIL